MCGGVYDIVVIFDFGLLVGGFVLEGGYSEEMMGLYYCFVPDELYLTKKMSFPPELVFPSKSPEVVPVI